MTNWGYDTLSAASGEEALDRGVQEDWRFDAIVADHRAGSRIDGQRSRQGNRAPGRALFPTLLVTGDTARERLT